MKGLCIAIGTLFLAGCASEMMLPTQADADRASIKYGQSSVEELKEGKKLYETNCNTCHRLYRPNSQTEKGWQHEVPSMSQKVNKSAGTEILDAAKQELIFRYLVTMSEAKTTK